MGGREDDHVFFPYPQAILYRGSLQRLASATLKFLCSVNHVITSCLQCFGQAGCVEVLFPLHFEPDIE